MSGRIAIDLTVAQWLALAHAAEFRVQSDPVMGKRDQGTLERAMNAIWAGLPEYESESPNETLAAEVISQMNDQDRASFDVDEWFDGVSNMCRNGEDVDRVLAIIEERLAR